MNMSGVCQPPNWLSHDREAFPCEPFGQFSIAVWPKFVRGHQTASEELRGQPSYTTAEKKIKNIVLIMRSINACPKKITKRIVLNVFFYFANPI